jgi:leucine-rich repeat protein SHOC2
MHSTRSGGAADALIESSADGLRCGLCSCFVAGMRGRSTEIVGDQAYFTGSTAELQKSIGGGQLDACGSLVIEGKLLAVPPEIGRLTQLRELILDTDTLQTIDAGIFACTQLVKLVVLSNQIKELPAGGWREMAALEQFIVTGSRALRELPDDLGDAPLIGGEFDLTPQIKLTALPRSFGRLARVTILRLPHKVAAPPEIAGMTGLRELRVRNVATLPEDIGALQELRLLDACESPITALPPSIGGAGSLRALGLSRTELTRLPDSVCELAALRDLDLIQTPIVELPEAIGRLGLARLRLQGTRISRLPDSLAAPAGDLRVYLPRDQRAALEASSAHVLAALGRRCVFE